MGDDGADGIPGPHYPTGSESAQRTRICGPNENRAWSEARLRDITRAVQHLF